MLGFYVVVVVLFCVVVFVFCFGYSGLYFNKNNPSSPLMFELPSSEGKGDCQFFTMISCTPAARQNYDGYTYAYIHTHIHI